MGLLSDLKLESQIRLMTDIFDIPFSSTVELVDRYGGSVSHAALNPLFSIFRAPAIDGLIGFRVVRGGAVVQGDPVCAPGLKTSLAKLLLPIALNTAFQSFTPQAQTVAACE